MRLPVIGELPDRFGVQDAETQLPRCSKPGRDGELGMAAFDGFT
jgi:hypothetical protein